MSEPLIVEIDLAALCVGEPDCKQPATYGPMADFSRLPQKNRRPPAPYLSSQITASGGSPGVRRHFLPGIHLHWALPDFMTQGRHRGTDRRIEFPEAPNRWLLTRLIADSISGALPSRSWIIESDRLSDEIDPNIPANFPQPTVPVRLDKSPAPFPNYQYLGAVFDLDGWSEQVDVPRLTPFTALGYGEPTFAAFYPNSSTVFGFLDASILRDHPSFDAATSSVTYHVVGWYSDPAKDPLVITSIHPNDNPFRLSFSGATPPAGTILRGRVEGIPWDPKKTYLDDTANAMTVSVATSPAEALSALLASNLSGDEFRNAEQTLNALQFGLLSNAGTVDAMARFEETIHEAGFGSESGGPLWTIKAREGSGVEDSSAIADEMMLPSALGGALDALNDLELQRSAAYFVLASKRRQLFADWHKYQIVMHQSWLATQQLQRQISDIAQYLLQQIVAIETMVTTDIPALDVKIDQQMKQILPQLGDVYELGNTAGAPRFFQPHDPILLLAGKDVVPVMRYGKDGSWTANGYMPCRLASEISHGFVLHAASAQCPITLPLSSVLPALPLPSGGISPGIIHSLLYEAIALSPSFTSILTSAFPGHIVMDRKTTDDTLRTGQRELLQTGTSGCLSFRGTLPWEPTGKTWQGTPWLPIMMNYSVDFYPVQPIRPSQKDEGYAADFINTNFQFDLDSIDLVFQQNSSAGEPGTSERYAGTVILTDKSSYDLSAAIQNFLNDTENADQELKDIQKELASLPQLSQSLGGLLDSMLMNHSVLQMRVLDPFAQFTAPFVSRLAAAVQNETLLSPRPHNPFNPIRTGSLEIDRIALIDVFGRQKTYHKTDMATVIAHALQPPSHFAHRNRAFLPPRISQPARLLFRWLSAADDSIETNSHPATSPVLGWVVPNYLDGGILLYSPEGLPLAAFLLAPDGKSVLFNVAPGSAFPPNATFASVFAGQSPHLVRFATLAWDGGADQFRKMFEAIRCSLDFSLPDAFKAAAGTAVLLGQPLALARAQLQLDLQGQPVADQSWISFEERVLSGAPADDFGLSQMQFPVKLGALDQLDDTLIGYFVENAGALGPFYSPDGGPGDSAVPPPIQLTPAADSSPTTVMMLLDPRGNVHATSGILPVKAINIPPSQYADALNNLSVSFLISPVLSGSNLNEMSLPLPRGTQGAWSWLAAAHGRWRESANNPQPDPNQWRSLAVSDAPAEATLDYTPQQIVEGWLVLSPAQAKSSMKKGDI